MDQMLKIVKVLGTKKLGEYAETFKIKYIIYLKAKVRLN